jgi:hypothetical protein
MQATLDAARVGLASSQYIISSQSAFKARLAYDWLPTPHPAVGGQILDSDGKPVKRLSVARGTFSNAQLVSLIAASGPNHCIDGWGFLARAASSLVAGDGHAARHFAYYAQLRGALSILAASGIGIFNGLNITVDSSGVIYKLEDTNENRGGTGTHGIVWPALDVWARKDKNAEQFLSAITVRGVSILDCIRSIWPSKQASAIVAPLVRNWALDLTIGTAHHVQRNISSYAPHQLNQISGSFQEEMSFLAQCWELLRPSTALGFDQLDVHFLRQTLQMIHEEDNSQLPEDDRTNLSESPISIRYDELDPAVKQSVPLQFLTSVRSVDEPNLFALAKNDGSTATSMMSRAILLLRASAGFTNLTLKAAGLSVDGSDLRPWLDPLALGRGFAAGGSPPELMANLWDEVGFAIEDFQEIVTTGGAGPAELYASDANGIPVVSQFERAGLWSLCP